MMKLFKKWINPNKEDEPKYRLTFKGESNGKWAMRIEIIGMEGYFIMRRFDLKRSLKDIPPYCNALEVREGKFLEIQETVLKYESFEMIYNEIQKAKEIE